jgi:hypothetical protein
MTSRASGRKDEKPYENAFDEYCLNDEEDDGRIHYHKSHALEEENSVRNPITSLVTQSSQPQEASDQHQSILFTLPFDIRSIIWTDVVGGGLVHITELKNHLGHVPCMDRSRQKWGMWKHDCWYCSLTVLGVHIAPESYGSPDDMYIRPGSLGLLRTCQRLYADAINILYECNTFAMRSLGTLHLFLDSLAPERLLHITSLYISPHVHSDHREWETTFRLLSTIPNLKRLRVELRGDLLPKSPWLKGRLLQAMCCVEQTEMYDVKVPWELEEIRDWIWACPFSLEGVYEEVIETGEKEYLALLRSQRVNVKDWFFPGCKANMT